MDTYCFVYWLQRCSTHDNRKRSSAGIGANQPYDEANSRDSIVISSSRRLEKIVAAPASISVITAQDLEQTASYSPQVLYATVQGLEFARSGIDVININARGFNNAFNAKMLELTDGRNTMFAGSSGLPTGKMNTVIKEDIDQMEIVLGPNSALYGPNAHNGVVNAITKDPRKYPGTTIALTGGNHGVMSARLRQATRINHNWAFKITGEYSTGNDFTFYDSVYAGGGVYGPSVVIPEKIKTFRFKHMKGDAHLLYTFTSSTHLDLSYGASSNNYIDVSNSTRNQGQGWEFSYFNAAFYSPHILVRLYETWTNAGQTYGIASYTRDYYNRTHSTITDPAHPLYAAQGYLSPDSAELNALRLGNRFKERSIRTNAEAQYNTRFKKWGIDLTTGITIQRDNPRTYGTILVDESTRVEITQFGGSVQLQKKLPANIQLMAAGRADHHSLFGNMFSPKMALLKHVKAGTCRLTWGRAFAAPIILFQRANVFGLILGNGNGVHYIPNGALINDLKAVAVTKALQPEEIATWELGYKGTIHKKIYVDVNGYYGKSVNFLSPAISIGGRALSVGDIPVPPTGLFAPGTVNADGILNNAAFSSYFNYGSVASYGIDLGINYSVLKNLSIGLKYSWFGSDITKDNVKNDANGDGYVSLEERSLNAPKNRVTGIININKLLNGKMYISVTGRWVEKYDMYSGSQIGTAAGNGKRGEVYGGVNPISGQPRYYLKNFNWGALGDFVTADVSGGYKLSERILLNATISNLLNVRQVEFVASPAIGRLFAIELKLQWPSRGKKGDVK